MQAGLFRSRSAKLLRQSIHRHFSVKASTRAPGQQIPAKQNLPLPLHERPAVHNAPSTEIWQWYTAAKQQTKEAAAKFTEPDDPSSQDVERELDWLMEDAVEGDWRLFSSQGPRQGSQTAISSTVLLRATLPEVQELWRLRLEARVPLQYLTNSAHWGKLVLAVGPGVLVPRPETYCLLDFAKQACEENPDLAKGVWADLGTGSGALALGLAVEMQPNLHVLAVDRSPDACAWAYMNAKRLQLLPQIQVLQGSWMEPVSHFQGKLAGIVSNPPYVQSHILPSLQAEVRLHEPQAALDGGHGAGLTCLAEICSNAADFLVPGGFLGLEMGGPQQTKAVCDLESLQADFRCIERRKDMFGVERFVTAIRA